MNVLAINTGSSSLKFGLFDAELERERARGVLRWTAPGRISLAVDGEVELHRDDLPAENVTAACWVLFSLLEEHHPGLVRSIAAVGHRWVHGGSRFREPVVLDAAAELELERLGRLAPLHHPRALEALRVCQEAFPGRPQIAVFDTSFFSELPEKAKVFPLPWSLYVNAGIQRFGFHGLSHRDAVLHAVERWNRSESPRIVVAHVGSGVSLAAARGSHPVATTMGFTPLDGVMMGTRPGSLDPGVLLHLLEECGYSPRRLQQLLQQESGLLGVSGVSADFSRVQQAAEEGNPRAQLALAMFLDRLTSGIASMAALLEGLDVLVFTGGVGEHHPGLRRHVCQALRFMGLHLDEKANRGGELKRRISMPESSADIWIHPADEERCVAEETARKLRRLPALSTLSPSL